MTHDKSIYHWVSLHVESVRIQCSDTGGGILHHNIPRYSSCTGFPARMELRLRAKSYKLITLLISSWWFLCFFLSSRLSKNMKWPLCILNTDNWWLCVWWRGVLFIWRIILALVDWRQTKVLNFWTQYSPNCKLMHITGPSVYLLHAQYMLFSDHNAEYWNNTDILMWIICQD